MKLRINGNSLRFRLGKSEVDRFGQSGSIDGTVRFGGSSESDLHYRLETTDGKDFSGKFSDGTIVVGVPRSIVDAWIGSEDVSISGGQDVDGEASLDFLIEKDFVCLNARSDEDRSDRFPHPKGADAC